MKSPQQRSNEISYGISELVAELEQEIDDLKEELETLKEENYLLTEALKTATTEETK